jgi:hypothetical protein
MDPDAAILEKVSKIDKFFESVLYDDTLDDWKLAKDLGELFVRLDREEITGHALLARACRHLGDTERALAELEKCRVLIVPPMIEGGKKLFVSFLEQEERLMSKPPDKAGVERDEG